MSIPAALLLLGLSVVLPNTLLANDAAPCPSICSCSNSGRVHCAFPTGRHNLSSYPSLAAYDKFRFGYDNITSLEGAELSNLRNATSIVLSNNLISKIPPREFSELVKLQELDLTYNLIVSLSAETFADMDELEELDLSFNLIQFIHDTAFVNLPSLRVLNLKHNEIQDIEGKFNFLTGLLKLKLSHNSLQTVENSSFQHLVNLQHLDLSSNSISYISEDAFYGLNNLLSLRLKGNPLSSMRWILSMDNSRSLRSLNTFDLSTASLETIPRELFQISPSLETIYLDENPWRCDRSLIFLRDEIQKYPDKFLDPQQIKCAYPFELNGHSVQDFEVVEPQPHTVSANTRLRSGSTKRNRVEHVGASSSTSERTRHAPRVHSNRLSPSRRGYSGYTQTSDHSRQQKHHKNKNHVLHQHHRNHSHTRQHQHSREKNHHERKNHKTSKGHLKHKKHRKHHNKKSRSEKTTGMSMSDKVHQLKTSASTSSHESASNPATLGLLIFFVVVTVALVIGIIAMKYRERIKCLPQAGTADRAKSNIVRCHKITGRGNSGRSRRSPSLGNVYMSNESNNGFGGTVHDATDNTVLTVHIDANEASQL